MHTQTTTPNWREHYEEKMQSLNKSKYIPPPYFQLGFAMGGVSTTDSFSTQLGFDTPSPTDGD